MSLADRPVVEVVRGRDLHRAGAELAVDVVVGDHRDVASVSGSARLADQMPIALVLGMHRDRGVAQHRLRARRGDDDRFAAVGERIADLPELALLLLGVDFEIGHRGAELRVPVDEPLAAIDEPVLVKAHTSRAPPATTRRPS